MEAFLRKGEVGWKSMTPSTFPNFFSYQFKACNAAEPEEACAEAKRRGRSHGTRAFCRRETLATTGSSVETRVATIPGTPRAASILHTTNGFPPSRFLFFPGKRRDPARARMSARIFGSRLILEETDEGKPIRSFRFFPDGTGNL